jgi:hypothetical protein
VDGLRDSKDGWMEKNNRRNRERWVEKRTLTCAKWEEEGAERRRYSLKRCGAFWDF